MIRSEIEIEVMLTSQVKLDRFLRYIKYSITFGHEIAFVIQYLLSKIRALELELNEKKSVNSTPSG